jgi:hypothetical protein
VQLLRAVVLKPSPVERSHERENPV